MGIRLSHDQPALAGPCWRLASLTEAVRWFKPGGPWTCFFFGGGGRGHNFLAVDFFRTFIWRTYNRITLVEELISLWVYWVRLRWMCHSILKLIQDGIRYPKNKAPSIEWYSKIGFDSSFQATVSKLNWLSWSHGWFFSPLTVQLR